MQIIPVIDLKDGQVVHAVCGDRSRYRPIHFHSRLTDSSDVDAVLAGFLELYPFRMVYIADLNAIVGNDGHEDLIATLLARYPHIQFWIDNGRQFIEHGAWPYPNYQTVIGTESQRAMPAQLNRDFILSLDFKQQQPAGDEAWFRDSTLWPENVIVMTLAKVGSGSGPDFQKLAELRFAYPDKKIVAAGGVRDVNDLIRLGEMGIDAALIATSLHSGALSGKEIINLRTKKYPGKPRYF
jgi:phosphoribosylformimino-5-aminoimidazole carboxamide ribotide isomerase